MAKVKLTRPEMKRQRDALGRFQRYLPMLKLKQQQLQLMVRQAQQKLNDAKRELDAAEAAFDPYRRILADRAGVNLADLSEPDEVKVGRRNIAGVRVPIFEEISFPEVNYSIFSTPAWVDRTLLDMRSLSERHAKQDILHRQLHLLQGELTKVVQRVNLFEKIKIPDCKDTIRRIRIKLGDESTSAVCRSKIAKGKLMKMAAEVSMI
jgi:V/A-type H+-transporting ATPase subunit D